MKKAVLFIPLALLCFILQAQVYGTTDDGKRVKLNKDGTWEYIESSAGDSAGKKAVKSFIKPASATSLVKSAKNNFGFWYDKSKWKLVEQDENEDAEFSLQMIDGDAYAMFISERIEIDLENLVEIALENAKAVDPETKLEVQEERIVNNQKVTFLQMSGKTRGIRFVYQGHYNSDESGTVQFVCFTGRSLLKDYEEDIRNLLNGFVKVK